MTIHCTDCCMPFEFSEKEKSFYEKHNFAPPKRCKKCRELRRNRNSFDTAPSNMGYKVSSFFENTRKNGLMMDVHNRDEHAY